MIRNSCINTVSDQYIFGVSYNSMIDQSFRILCYSIFFLKNSLFFAKKTPSGAAVQGPVMFPSTISKNYLQGAQKLFQDCDGGSHMPSVAPHLYLILRFCINGSHQKLTSAQLLSITTRTQIF